MHAPTAAPAAARRTAARWWLLGLAAVALVRLCCLAADPSPSMPDATIMDEGLWADSARGHVLFGDWFADDLGDAYLVAPLYTWLLTGIYTLFGIGLWQTRLLSALAGIGVAALCGARLWRQRGDGAAIAATLAIGLCPLLDQHARFGLLESTQSFWLLLSFVLLFPQRRATWKAALAGVAMAAAVLVKPNSATYGALPLGLAFLWAWRGDAPDARRRRRAEAVACAAAGAAALLAVGLPVWLPHWDAFRASIDYESGSANWRLGDHLLRLGIVGAREQYPGHLRLSALLRHAPLLVGSLWLVLLRRAHGATSAERAAVRPLWIWLAVGVLIDETSYDHVARRQVLLLPIVAMLAADAWAQRRAAPVACRPWPAYCRWLCLLAPLLLLAKPVATNALEPTLAALGAPRAGGTPGLLAAWIVTLAALLLPLLPTALGAATAPWHRRLAALAPLLLAAAALSEFARLGALPPHGATIPDAQHRLAPLVEPGEIVLGEHAATLFQSVRVRTVRRVIAGEQYSSPRPNPDVAARLRPRYVLDYAAPALRQFGDVTASGFERIDGVGLLREADGTFRFDVELWRRR